MDSCGTIKYRALTIAFAGFIALTSCEKHETTADKETRTDAISAPTPRLLERAVTLGVMTYNYTVYLPARWGTHQTWPLIVSLHNIHWQRKNRQHAHSELEKMLGEEHVPLLAIALFPQCPLNRYWGEPEMQAMVLEEIKQTEQEFRGDEQRVYLIGHGMGGYGTWTLAAAHPDIFAALVPIAAGIRLPNGIPCPRRLCSTDSESDSYSAIAQKIQRIPVWLFHGANDQLIPVSEAQQMHKALRALGGSVRYTEYAGVGHHCWRRAYREPELWPWLLAQRRGQ